MKKQLLIASLLMLTVSNLNFSVFSAEETNIQTQNSAEKVLSKRERPKLYDANGNELTTPPKIGQDVYDANGNKLEPPKREHNFENKGKMKPPMKPPTVYDKDGNALTTPPQMGQDVYDANGNKLDAPKGRPPQNFNKNNE